ncbi:hypothetical protein B0E52_00730 [Rhodanobacter sp. C06]|uniref:hypothetical protein n=1 Tax=Rhodanobacter sp. C06 TaxID=1945854 RepID=UPI000986661C|nr:hypothetical protein [Rhodanobacter sp. C06]OOG49752.1 hypothetical protein B0E52_00730 [Rhodanobacter sp. C06]
MNPRHPPEPDRVDASRQVPAVIGRHEEANRVTQAILDFVSRIPDSKVDGAADPQTQARQLAGRAAQRAALTAGTLALPPGPLGWLTVLPELVAIWKIQAQMVSDIAAAYGRHAELGREQMLYCLFRHTAAQAFRDLVVRMGDRLLFRRMSHAVVERIAKQLGVKLSRRALGEGVSRWLPVIGALGVGAYAYYDTGQVAATAIELFGGGIEHEGSEAQTEPPAPAHRGTASVRKSAGEAARKLAGAARKVGTRRRRPPSDVT